jgi:hypothetical protein
LGLRRKVEFKNHEPKFPAPLEGYAATVELPEGHHVTIGELTPGTIVEVATWDGTGKPDETTKRFLISADGTGLSRRTGSEQPQVENKPQAAITDNSFAVSAISSTQPIADPIFGSYRETENFRNSAANAREITFRDSSSFGMKLLKGVGIPLMLIAVIVGGLKFVGVSATVPTVGAKSFFGSSTNSIVLYKKTTNVTSGTPVVAKDNDVVVFGNYGGDVGNLSLFTINDSQYSVPKESISGRGFLLIPYIGSLLKPILS